MNRTLGALLLLLALPVSAGAQPRPPDWTLQVKLGKPIFLTTEAGERVEGVAGQVTPDAILVSTPVGIRTVPYRELRRAEKRDALWTGAAVGAAVGAALGVLVVANGDCVGNPCGAEESGFVIGSAGYGALIGWGIDALVKGRTTLFESDAATTVAIAPRRGGVSAGVTFSW